MFCCRPQVALVDPIKDTPLNIGYIQHVEFISGWQDGRNVIAGHHDSAIAHTELKKNMLERRNFLLQYYH